MQRALAFLLLMLLASLSLFAEKEKKSDLLSVGVGVFNVLRDKQRTIEYQLEYEWGANWNDIHPIVGLMVTQHKGLFIYGGFSIDLQFGPILFSPSFAPGYYYKGDGKDLGFPLEFRSAVALAYVFKNQSRLGLQFYHISNAKLGNKNPGEESLVLFYSFALGRR